MANSDLFSEARGIYRSIPETNLQQKREAARTIQKLAEDPDLILDILGLTPQDIPHD